MEESNVILKVENISKQYRLGTLGTGTISHDLNRWWHRIRGKEDPYLKIGETNDRSTKGTSEYVWALKDISFEVKKGEILGIIGKNGAGKSTLLKILSRVTGPTTGSIKTKGRIASLLEVGTGFHPEMTGRENVYLNGAILGMTKKEINAKIDEIIAFSGCERYIDTPTKRYSSGMTVRLAFAVAAFLEPDILVVDEVLAVGDAEFQKKAIGKMQDISNSEGRTVLFVSHNMAAVKSLCTRGVVLENGGVGYNGGVNEGISYYLSNNTKSTNSGSISFENKKNRKINYIKLSNANHQITDNFFMNDSMNITVGIKNDVITNDVKLSLLIISSSGEKIAAVRSDESMNFKHDYVKGDFEFKIEIENLNLMPKTYFVTVALAIDSNTIEIKQECLSFKIHPLDIFNTGKIPKGNFINFFKSKWSIT